MQRFMGGVVAPGILITVFILVLILLGFVVNETKSAQPGIVHVKDTIKGGDRDGEITKSDNYVVVKSDAHGKEVFTWDQILYISEKDPAASRKLDRVVDLIDLLSKLGIAVTVVFFMVGLYQYSQTQKWEREKFLAATVKEFLELQRNRNAMHMIDSLAMYRKGRMVEIYHQEDKAKDRKVFVTNDEIYEALTTTPNADLEETDVRAIAIRDCFDSFLSYMGTFDHYVEQDLITTDALRAHLGYWIDLLGPTGDLAQAYKTRIFAYATKYGLTDFENLIGKYNRPSLSERVRGWFIK